MSMQISPPAAVSVDFSMGVWAKQLEREPTNIAWLWQGFLAPGNVTLLTSQWKSGKTTLISILLARLGTGGVLAGQPVRAGRALIVSEETRAQWRSRHQKLDLHNVYFLCQPFRGKPRAHEWLALLDHIAVLHAQQPFALVVIDTLTAFLPGHSEANATVVMEALLPLRRLTTLGISVLLSHHPCKGPMQPGQAARGSGALPSFTDVNLEMSWYDGQDRKDRRRRIMAFSRYEETPPQLVVEWNTEGTDYLVQQEAAADEFVQEWTHLRMVLEDATQKLTRKEILEEWPADFVRPSDTSLYRWLLRAAAANLLCQEGSGRRADPFRYWLPEIEKRWEDDPLYALRKLINEDQKNFGF